MILRQHHHVFCRCFDVEICGGYNFIDWGSFILLHSFVGTISLDITFQLCFSRKSLTAAQSTSDSRESVKASI